ncbi:hypothetical protein MKX01_023411 [Papaver californicum]|nr:hypothetical protein MKX01_023411 [Papaver californicum]
MGKKKQVKIDANEAEYHLPLQAVLIADDFAAEKFQPITMERPKVLLPLVYNPMIDYSLAWLRASCVKEVFVVCCSHSKQVIDYLEKSEWSVPEFTVRILENRGCVSVGDALRFVYESDVIHGDFVLISGDIVSNMSLTQALKDHKERKKRDSNAIITMVIKKSKPSSSSTNQTSKDRLVMGIDPNSQTSRDGLVMGIDHNTKELLYYDMNFGKDLLLDNPAFEVHNDKEDCCIDICSPVVLSLFADNFDFQHLRCHLVKGLLDDDVMGYKLFTYEIHSSRYAARVDNLRSYDTISKDVIQQWTYPFVPDIQFSANCPTKQESHGIYKGSDIQLSSSAHVVPDTLVGSGTSIGDYSKISNSVIGKGCCIGSNVSIEGSYVWDNVTIQDGCQLNNALVCDGVVIKSGVVLEPGVVLSFKVVVDTKFPMIPAYSKVSLHPQPTNQHCDEYAQRGSGILGGTSLNRTLDLPNGELISRSSDVTEVGVSGVDYYIWSDTPKPEMLPGAELRGDGETYDFDNDDDFDIEVDATILRAVLESEDLEDVKLEVTALRLSYNIDEIGITNSTWYQSKLFRNVVSVIATWRDLLRHYIDSIDEQIETIMKFEEICLDSGKDFARMFDIILHELYQKDVLAEEAILLWASEKEGADASDKFFVNQSQNFIQWLIEAEEEED